MQNEKPFLQAEHNHLQRIKRKLQEQFLVIFWSETTFFLTPSKSFNHFTSRAGKPITGHLA